MKQKDTPQEELADLSAIVKAAGIEIQVHIEAEDGVSTLTVSDNTPEEITQRVINLTRQVLCDDIRSDWDEGAGVTGTFRIDGSDEPWLNLDDREDDWTHEHVPDLDYSEWSDETRINDDAPSP